MIRKDLAAVAPDDLNAPLGLGKGKRLPKLPASPPQNWQGRLACQARGGGVGDIRS
jgi:hypothetical protein